MDLLALAALARADQVAALRVDQGDGQVDREDGRAGREDAPREEAAHAAAAVAGDGMDHVVECAPSRLRA